jgi:hypothetical protein
MDIALQGWKYSLSAKTGKTCRQTSRQIGESEHLNVLKMLRFYVRVIYLLKLTFPKRNFFLN